MNKGKKLQSPSLMSVIAGAQSKGQKQFMNSLAKPPPMKRGSYTHARGSEMAIPGQKLKFVWAHATDTDPPTNPIKVVDNVSGINPPNLLLKDLQTPCDTQFGAVGDGVTDDTLSMQAWLDAISGRAGFGCAGVFGVSSTLLIDTNTSIYGSGEGNFIIQKLAGFPANMPLIKNRNEVLSPAPQVDTNINLYAIGFSGRSGDTVTQPLISFVGVASFVIRNCVLKHNRSYLLACSNTANGVVDQNEFFDWGQLSGAGGQAIWFNNTNSDAQISGNFIHDGQYAGILCDGANCTINGNRVYFAKEGGITGVMRNGDITGNIVNAVRRRVAAGNGIGVGGFGVTIVGNTVSDTDDASIYLANTSVVNCTSNVCNLPNQINAPVAGSVGAITLVTTVPNGVENTIISDNNCSGRDGKGTYGIACYNFGGSTMLNVSITNNQLGIKEGWTGAPIFVAPNVRGQNWVQRGNNYNIDLDPVNVAFRIDSGTAGASFLTIGGVGFQPRSIQFSATTAGGTTAAGSIGWAMQEAVWNIGAQAGTSPVFQSDCNFWSTDAGGSASGNRGATSCIYLIEGDATTVICDALLTGLTDDGFNLLTGVDPTTQDVYVTATCYP